MKCSAPMLLMLAAACAREEPVRIDGRSQHSFERTAGRARRQLPIADRLTFHRAIRTVGGRRFATRDPAALARVTFDQMTAADIVADQKLREK